MKTIEKILTFYPYEYRVLEEYLCDMSKKGYQLISLKGDHFFAIATFQEYEGTYIQYVCDYTASNGFFQEDSDETIAYRSFIEEYGYTYISSFHGVLIFSTAKPIRFEIREYHVDNKKQLRKATLYHLISYTCICFMYMLIFHVMTTTIGDYAKSNISILYYMLTRVMLIPYLWMIAQPLLYLIGINFNTKITTIHRRAMILSSTLMLWMFSMFQMESSIKSLLEMFLFIIAGILLLYKLWNWMKQKAITKRGIYFALSSIMYVVLLLVYVQNLQDDSIKDDDVPIMLNKEDVYITSTFLPSREYHSSYLMSEVDIYYEAGQYYNIQHVKDTPISGYLKERLIYNSHIMDVEKRDEFMIYDRSFDVAIVSDRDILSVSHDTYEQMSTQDIKTLCKQIQKEML